MRPDAPHPWRREIRRGRRGLPRARRRERPVRTTYGRRQRQRDRLLEWQTFHAERAAELDAGTA